MIMPKTLTTTMSWRHDLLLNLHRLQFQKILFLLRSCHQLRQHSKRRSITPQLL